MYKSGCQSQQLLIYQDGLPAGSVGCIVLVPVVAQSNRSLSCLSAVGQVSRRVDQLVGHVNGGLNDRLNLFGSQLTNSPIN